MAENAPGQVSVEPLFDCRRDRGFANPIVIIGNGPVGMRVARELIARDPDVELIIYGEEAHEPYNRVRLSSWLSGEISHADLTDLSADLPPVRVDQRLGFRIIAIDPARRVVTDHRGHQQHYQCLILATGSFPHVPEIPGISLAGVYTLRNLDDAQRLYARQARTHRTVVIGGGLLGLEAARGMQAGNTDVTIIEHADRLLANQLDNDASDRLQQQLEDLGLTVLIGDGIREILGCERVAGVQLRSGRTVACDTVLISTGIRPNIELARAAGLSFGRGIKVDSAMRTSDPAIYAVGECAEHQGEVYGLVAPGFEQAAVCANTIAGQPGLYRGSIAACRLKVVGTQVFSMGPMGITASPFAGASYQYANRSAGTYRKILVRRNKLIGAISLGAWTETVRLQTHIGNEQRIYPWQIVRFVHTGRLWSEDDGAQVATWPASAIVCQCNGVSRAALSQAIEQGAQTVDEVSRCTNASTVCGSCKPLVADLLGQPNKLEPATGAPALVTLGVVGLVVAMLFLFGPKIEYASSVQLDSSLTQLTGVHWDVLWRDGTIKQWTGYSVLTLAAMSLLISFRKRQPHLHKVARFDYWRMAHISLGTLVIALLIAHTGFRMGHGLNFLLMLSFTSLLFVGALSSLFIGLSHRLPGGKAVRLRRQSVFIHILLFWPVPVLLAWHIFKTYWY